MTPSLRSHKLVIVGQLNDAPAVSASGYFYPYKFELTAFKNRVKVTLVGRLNRVSGGYNVLGRSVSYGIAGYDQYPPCPAWLVPLIREAGYHGDIRSE